MITGESLNPNWLQVRTFLLKNFRGAGRPLDRFLLT